MGAARHLDLIDEIEGQTEIWPVPFADGIDQLLSHRGRQVVVLASGDPFWFGTGSVFARHLVPEEWHCLPAPSTFSIAAAYTGWPLEKTLCLGLHARPFTVLRPYLASGLRAIVLVRDGKAVPVLAAYLTELGFGDSTMTVMEALGGPRQKVRSTIAKTFRILDIAHPVCVAIKVAGDGIPVPLATGRADDFFDHNGQITKRPVRALALSALAPRFGEHLWDIGAGSGSISVEWLLSGPSLTATAFESRPDRAGQVTVNADRFGLSLPVIQGTAPACLIDKTLPDAVFVGGGASEDLFHWLWCNLPLGTRVVVHGVTLETEALLPQWHAAKGGQLMRIDLSEASPLGTRRGWKAAYPVMQWSVTV